MRSLDSFPSAGEADRPSGALSQLDEIAHDRHQLADQVVHWIGRYFSDPDGSLDGLLESLTSQPGGARLADALNVWPATGTARCAPVLVVVARGRGGRKGYTAAMAAIRRHLVTCSGITRAVVMVTDTWVSFDKLHRADWLVHARSGVQFRVMVAGAGVRGAAELRLKLGR